MTVFWVALAGGLGALARFILDGVVARRGPRVGVPLGTIAINVIGSLLLGVVVGWSAGHLGDGTLRTVLGVGFLGGFTTFSTASVEAARLALAGEGWRLLLHTGGMLISGVAAAGLGLWLGSL